MILIDTDILIDFARGIGHAKKYLEKLREEKALAISSITHMELLVGCRNKKEQKKLNEFLTQYEEIPPDTIVIEKSIELLKLYRLSHYLLIPDAIIAATAISENIPLASKNAKDFKFITGLKFTPYSSKS